MAGSFYGVQFHDGIDLADTQPYAFSLVYRSNTQAQDPELHTHPTGLLGVQICCGAFGVQLSERRLAVPKHAAFWIPPDVPHCTVQAADVVSICLHIAPEVCKQYLPDKPVRFVLNPMTEEMIKHFARVWQNTNASVSAMRIAKLIVSELTQTPHLQEGFAPVPDNPYLREIVEDMIDTRKTEHKNMQQWAERFGISTKTLGRLTLKLTGMSYSQWSTQFRLLPALNALSEGKTVEDTAYACGYETTSAFIAAFTRVFGLTPGKYRRTDATSDFPETCIYPLQNG